MTINSPFRIAPLAISIRKGSLLRPQTHGCMLDPKEGASCALGASYEAALNGLWIASYNGLLTDVETQVLMQRKIALEKYWETILSIRPESSLRPLGVVGIAGLSVESIIFHLNDECHWTREAIADWVESIENALGSQAYPLPEPVDPALSIPGVEVA